jgi:hypothetical protein
MTWHVETPVWEAYVAGRLDAAAEASVDTHVVACPACRAQATSVVPGETREAVWAAVREQITVSPEPLAPRLLRRLGVPSDNLVIVSAADALLLPWGVAVGLAIACACVVGLAGLGPVDQHAVFLAMAPLVPVLAVVTAFEVLDPLREVASPTPYSKLRLALLRGTAALTVALPATFAVGVVVPDMHDLAFVWLLPSLGLTIGGLGLLTWLDARVAGAVVGVAWVTAIVVLRVGGRISVVTTPATQVACLALAGLLALILFLRTSTLRLQGGVR